MTRKMSTTFLSRCSLAALLLASGCYASWDVRDVIVTASDGLPCFSVNPPSSTNNVFLYSIDILEETSEPVDSAWALQVTDQKTRIPISNGSCLLFGTSPKGTVRPSSRGGQFQLDPAKRYLVTIEPLIESGTTASPQLYVGRFCFQADKTGVMVAKSVPWNNGSKKYDYSVCVKPMHRSR